MGERDAQLDDIDTHNGNASAWYTREWTGTCTHPDLPGANLAVVWQASDIMLYDGENSGAWIRGEATEVGVASHDEGAPETIREG